MGKFSTSGFKCDQCGCKMGFGDFQSIPSEIQEWDFHWYCKECFIVKMRKIKLQKINKLNNV
jgi:hypothetical protein